MRTFLVLVIALLLSSCGYQFTGTGGVLPGNVKVLYLETLVNRTSEPRLAIELTSSINQRLSRNSSFVLTEDRTQAEAVLRGQIVEYGSRVVAYDSDDEIRRVRAHVRVVGQLVENTPEEMSLWDGTLFRANDYSADDDKLMQETLEEFAISELSKKLADDFYDKLVNDF